MRAVVVSALVACLGLAACGKTEEPVVRDGPRPEPVVVYASHGDVSYWPGLFAGFTRETGIRVTVKHGDPEKIVGDVIAKRGSPPADLLLTPSVVGVWQAADEGALLPLGSELVTESVPEQFRDSDGYWTAISLQTAQIVFDPGRIDAAEVTGFEALAEPVFRNKLCLSSANLAVNRAVITTLIRQHGTRPAEVIVRGWVANLALPPMDSETKLLRAIDAGTCAAGIASAAGSRAAVGETSRVAHVVPEPATISVEAAGINRHAREPESARRLLEWMLSAKFQAQHTEGSAMEPVITGGGRPDVEVAVVGSFDEDAVNLAARARYR